MSPQRWTTWRGNALALNQVIEEAGVVALRRKIHHIRVVALGEKIFACRYGDDVSFLLSHFVDQLLAVGRRIAEHEPWACDRRGRRQRRRFPGGVVEPIVDFDLGLLQPVRTDFGPHPEFLPLKGVGGQGHAPAFFVRVEGFPVDLDSVDPQISQGREHGGKIAVFSVWAGQGRENTLGQFPAAAVAGERAERFARADFEEKISGVGFQDFQAIAEPDRFAEMAPPIGGVGRVLVRQPGARYIRDQRNLRSAKLFLADQLDK